MRLLFFSGLHAPLVCLMIACFDLPHVSGELFNSGVGRGANDMLIDMLLLA